jgi:class 3 adenylate cyclase/predicted ATPase
VSSDALTSDLERRTVTIMFCDLVGSTELSGRLDPEDLGNVLLRYRESCTRIVHRFGGVVTRYVGDSLLVCFGYPIAHDDDAKRAVNAALHIRSELERTSSSLEGFAGAALSAHIGIHTGEVLVGDLGTGPVREQFALVGETPNIAARLQGEAGPDEIVISQATYRLTKHAFTCDAMPPVRLKGVECPVAAFRVNATQEERLATVSSGDRLSDLVGRAEELEMLARRWDRVLNGSGQVVLLSGEPGIGKTCLLRALMDRCGLDVTKRSVCQCSPYFTNTAYFPFVENIRRQLGLRTQPTQAAVLAALQVAVHARALARRDDLGLVAAVVAGLRLGDTVAPELSPQAQREKFMEWLVDWLTCHPSPHIVVVEDLHWADASTLDFLSLLVDRVSELPVFVVLTFRAELRVPWPVRSHVLHLTLGRLSPDDAIAFIRRLTEGRDLPPPVLQQILAKTDGVPLFVEEFTKMVVEAGALDAEALDARGAAGRQQIPIPETLRGMLLARLDRQGNAKVVAQIAAVIDREISFRLLGTLSGLDETTLKGHLRSLVDAELLLQRGSPPESTYVFRHSLIRDAAYHSLLKSSRARYHKETAEVLLQHFPVLADSHPEFVAHHFSEAGLGARAFGFWRAAGLRALEGSANVEATAHLRSALRELPAVPRGSDPVAEVELQIALGAALTAARGYGSSEVADAYARAFALCENLGDEQRLFAALTGLHSFYQVRGPLDRAREVAERLLALASKSRDESQLAQAHRRFGWSLFCGGEMKLGKEHLDVALNLFDATKSREHNIVYGAHPWIVGSANSAWVEWIVGHPDVARERSQSAIGLAREMGRPLPLAYALGMSAAMYQCQGEPGIARDLAAETIALARDNGMPYWMAWGSVLHGWATARAGDWPSGMKTLEEGLGAYRRTGAELFRPHCLCLLAETLQLGGRRDDALEALSEALRSAGEQNVHFYTAEILRLKGTLLLEALDSEQAEISFREAAVLARSQGAGGFEQTALNALAELLQRAGRVAEADDIQSDVRQRLAGDRHAEEGVR